MKPLLLGLAIIATAALVWIAANTTSSAPVHRPQHHYRAPWER